MHAYSPGGRKGREAELVRVHNDLAQELWAALVFAEVWHLRQSVACKQLEQVLHLRLYRCACPWIGLVRNIVVSHCVNELQREFAHLRMPAGTCCKNCRELPGKGKLSSYVGHSKQLDYSCVTVRQLQVHLSSRAPSRSNAADEQMRYDHQ